jgi:hypothetical protein
MLEGGAEGGAMDTSSLPGALDFMALWVGLGRQRWCAAKPLVG